VIFFWLPLAASHDPLYCGVMRGLRRCSIPHAASSWPVSRAMKADPLSLLSTKGGPCSQKSEARTALVVSAPTSGTGCQASW